MSRVLIEDDPVLLEIAREWAIQTSQAPLRQAPCVMVITTDDVALCSKINKLYPQIVVMRISAKRDAESIGRIKQSISATHRTADVRFFDDEGSLSHSRASTATLFNKMKGEY